MQSEKSVDRLSTPVTRPPFSSAASVLNSVVSSRRRGDFPLSVAAVSSPHIRQNTHFIHHSLFHYLIERSATLRSPRLPRGSKNFVSSCLCGENSLTGTQPLVKNPGLEEFWNGGSWAVASIKRSQVR